MFLEKGARRAPDSKAPKREKKRLSKKKKRRERDDIPNSSMSSSRSALSAMAAVAPSTPLSVLISPRYHRNSITSASSDVFPRSSLPAAAAASGTPSALLSARRASVGTESFSPAPSSPRPSRPATAAAASIAAVRPTGLTMGTPRGSHRPMSAAAAAAQTTPRSAIETFITQEPQLQPPQQPTPPPPPLSSLMTTPRPRCSARPVSASLYPQRPRPPLVVGYTQETVLLPAAASTRQTYLVDKESPAYKSLRATRRRDYDSGKIGMKTLAQVTSRLVSAAKVVSKTAPLSARLAAAGSGTDIPVSLSSVATAATAAAGGRNYGSSGARSTDGRAELAISSTALAASRGRPFRATGDLAVAVPPPRLAAVMATHTDSSPSFGHAYYPRPNTPVTPRATTYSPEADIYEDHSGEQQTSTTMAAPEFTSNVHRSPRSPFSQLSHSVVSHGSSSETLPLSPAGSYTVSAAVSAVASPAAGAATALDGIYDSHRFALDGDVSPLSPDREGVYQAAMETFSGLEPPIEAQQQQRRPSVELRINDQVSLEGYSAKDMQQQLPLRPLVPASARNRGMSPVSVASSSGENTDED